MDLPAHGDRVLLHRLEHGRLGFGRGAVDLVGQHDLREDRARLKLEDAAAVGQLHDHVGADDIGGHQVGGELDAVEVEIDRLGQGSHQQRLAQPGNAFEQRMTADEQAGQDAVDDLVVADDHLADLSLDLFVSRAKALGAGFHRFGWKRAHSGRSFRGESPSFSFSRSSQTRCLALSRRLV